MKNKKNIKNIKKDGMSAWRIQTKTSKLLLGIDGVINATSRENNKTIFKTTVFDFWKITLQEPSDESARGRKFILKSSLPDTVKGKKNRIQLIWNHLETTNRKYAISLEIFIQAVDDTFEIKAKIFNEEKIIIVRELEMPSLDIPLRRGHSQLLFPKGAGYKFDLTKEPKRRMLGYPGASVHCVLVDHGDRGLYLGSHDKYFTASNMITEPIDDNNALRCRFTVISWVRPGDGWVSEPIVVANWHNGWKDATKYYRNWVNTWFVPPKRPEWIKNITGWILCIMKQQNGEVIWNWDDMDELCDRAEKQGLNMLGLFGWTEGGHDRDYPTYIPLGEDENKAKQAIRRAQARGIRVVLYTNGQLIDIQGEYYKSHGLSIATVSERGEPFLQGWQKYYDAPMKAHAFACQGTEEWGNKLIEMAELVNNMGADGILYDQIGFGGGSAFCFNEAHKHKHPAQVMTKGVVHNLRRAQEHMEKKDPDFIIMTEGGMDCTGMYIDIIHGAGGSYFPEDNSFPDLFFTIFPEYRGYAIQRIASPVQDEKNINYAMQNDFLFEVEYRYRADRDLLAGKTVTEENYDEVFAPLSRPALSLIGIPFEESAKRMKNAIGKKIETQKE